MKSAETKLKEQHAREADARRLLGEWAREFASVEEASMNATAALDSLCLAAGTFTNARHARMRLEKKLRRMRGEVAR